MSVCKFYMRNYIVTFHFSPKNTGAFGRLAKQMIKLSICKINTLSKLNNYCITHCFPLTDSSQKDVIVPAVRQRDIEEASVVESIANSKVHPGADVFDLNLCCYVQR